MNAKYSIVYVSNRGETAGYLKIPDDLEGRKIALELTSREIQPLAGLRAYLLRSIDNSPTGMIKKDRPDRLHAAPVELDLYNNVIRIADSNASP